MVDANNLFCYKKFELKNYKKFMDFNNRVARLQLIFDMRSLGLSKDHLISRKNKVPFSIAIGNVEIMHECPPNTCAWEQQK